MEQTDGKLFTCKVTIELIHCSKIIKKHKKMVGFVMKVKKERRKYKYKYVLTRHANSREPGNLVPGHF